MEDTIAAIATAQGEGGIGIIRISGDEAYKILKNIFRIGTNEQQILNRKLMYGHIVHPQTKEILDEVLAVYMMAPKTYTAEDVVEIHCHGSVVSLRKVLTLVLQQGVRLAEKGEFTKRAFLNGRIDLSQAEAVIDVIKAKTDKGFQVAFSQMEGILSAKIRELREEITDLLVNVTVNLDYPDEDIEELTYENLIENLTDLENKLDKLLLTASSGRMIREGLKVTIVGKPNVGKSSLMNMLLRESRAIVTEIPGTTRDTIEEVLTIRDIPVRLTDTAGIRYTEDKIEKIGIEKSKESFNQADLVIFMIDGSREIEDEDLTIIEHLKDKKCIVLINKCDVGNKITASELKKYLPDSTMIQTSMKENLGLSELEDQIVSLVYGGEIKPEESILITNVRHQNLLQQAKNSLHDASTMAHLKEALDFIEVDIKSAWESLGEIIGETVTDDIIDKVFERFCLGK